MSQLTVDVPDALLPLTQPARYKAAYGGRGGGKSHFFAEQIVLRCYAKKTRVACIREVQATLRDSVRQLLIDRIYALGLDNAFEIRDSEIRCRHNGSLIIFKGMQSYNAHSIKSLEDIDIAWVEEAQTFSDISLRLLRPTIRAENSEIWFSWNPRHDSDAVDRFFRAGQPPDSAIIVPVNWSDNPWFPAVLVEERERDYAADPDMADHIWEGGYERYSEQSFFGKAIAAAEHDGRVGFFPHIPELPVSTGWDLGVDDYTVIWFFQVVEGPRVRVIDFYEASGLGADDIVAEAMPEYTRDSLIANAALGELDRATPYQYQRHFLPHDVRVREWGLGAKSRVETLNGLGLTVDSMHRGVAQNPTERINATRRLLPICEFHQTKRVMLGLTHLRRYARKRNEALGTYLGPLHDEHSHAADAFGEFAVNCGIVAPMPKPEPRPEDMPPPPGKFRDPGPRQYRPTEIDLLGRGRMGLGRLRL